MGKQPESKLVAKLQDMVRLAGGYPIKIHGGDNPFQAEGIPDLLCCIYGRFVGIEAKLPGEKLRGMQRVTLHEIHNAGGVAAVVETVGQGAVLLSTLSKESLLVPSTVGAICFDRGTFRHVFDLSG